MTDIVANPEWKSVRILEREEVALGGVNGNMNEQATSLVARTELLMEEKLDKTALQPLIDGNVVVTGNIEYPEFSVYSTIKINGVPLKRAFNMRDYRFEKPLDFGWDVNGHTFWLDKDGVLQSDINPDDYDVASKAVGVVEYFVSSLGTDTSSNLGTDPSSPLRSVNGAINRINVDLVENAIIWMQPTNYDDGFTWGTGTSLSSTISIKAWNMNLVAPYADTSDTPIVFSANDTSLGWVLTSGNTYQKTRANTSAITDSSIINKYGDPSFYEKALSLQECNETSGTWFQDGSMLYVHTLDNRVPDSNINVYVSKTLGKATTGNFSLYIERAHFHGGTLPFSVLIEAGASDQTVFLNKCRYWYGNENGLQIRGVRLTICYECESAYNRDDGLNYHSELGGTTRPTKVIEFKCKSYRNGQSWSPLSLTNQGSTTHDASHIVRAGCVYFDNGRQAVTDVGDSRSWIISSQGYAESEKRYEGSYYSVFQCAEGKMWLDHCDASGHDYAVASTNNGKIYTRNSNLYPSFYTAQNIHKW